MCSFRLSLSPAEYLWGFGAAEHYFKLKHDSLTRTSNFKGVSFYHPQTECFALPRVTFIFLLKRIYPHTIARSVTFDKFWGFRQPHPTAIWSRYSISQYDLYPQLLKHLLQACGWSWAMNFKTFTNSVTIKMVPVLFDQQNVVGKRWPYLSMAPF